MNTLKSKIVSLLLENRAFSLLILCNVTLLIYGVLLNYQLYKVSKDTDLNRKFINQFIIGELPRVNLNPSCEKDCETVSIYRDIYEKLNRLGAPVISEPNPFTTPEPIPEPTPNANPETNQTN